VYVDDTFKNNTGIKYIFAHRIGSDNVKNIFSLRHALNKWYVWVSDADGVSSQIMVPDTLTVDWHYLAVRWSSSELALFIDGTKVDSVPNPKLPNALAPTMNIGSWAGGEWNWANTVIDEFRISNRARTDQEIQAAYNSNSSLPVDAWTTLKLDFNGNLNAQVGQ